MRAAAVHLALTPLLAAAVLGSTPVAFADPEVAPPTEAVGPPPVRSPVRRWYGFQTLGADTVALVFLVPAIGSHDPGIQEGFAWSTLLTYWLGGPIVHFAHGALGKGAGDLGLRLAMPVVGGLLGSLVGTLLYSAPSCSSTGSCPSDDLGKLGGTLVGAGAGALLGVGGAVAMDAALLAYEPVHGDHSGLAPPRTRPLGAVHVEPTVGVTPERLGGTRATFALVGSF